MIKKKKPQKPKSGFGGDCDFEGNVRGFWNWRNEKERIGASYIDIDREVEETERKSICFWKEA